MLEPIIEVKEIVVQFGGLTALDKLSLIINHNEVLGLLGPNGSGKTTLFNVMTGIYRAKSGSIYFQQQDLCKLSPQAIFTLGISRTFQRSRLSLDLTVFDNIAIGRHLHLTNDLFSTLFKPGVFKQEYRDTKIKIMDLMGLFCPHLIAQLEKPVHQLSMIDRRRIEVCRALITEPKLLLLDEPSAGMTHDETHELMSDVLLAKKKIGNISIVLIEHEMSVIKSITERCIVLSYGKLIAEGPYQNIIQHHEVQKAYLGEEVA
ncbi:MAG: ABC transporter ATP-binding protein [Ferrovum sp. 37-45-19]|jgi:branched-chain amino acid transport system ATP-binding protein/sulfate-transporting ATPase|uniref:ABC transporter ATP-binding protein n=1 Tax=Ferrovum sp. JA12 TaxID=1356299 RepID=UPI0007038BDE|nr:ABC transporter ATP-binding protein [Ferrovum sp. JA12]OYV79433.1 MAG: ABC transporter ATP-binding protein [Ferrovum sp. 21-44-67]OYV94988.1 MAG: ABC transporter ATP-binding protein [Ferrovum sp. 37-45-19]OZB34232.1 MAG: ABC transporter ATP-binding protein [Ferrovum sp. 34-44-207]HQT80957.1 ABC transporter ATP-binding protein [Ferrovaceae bacterium]KRH78798.1 lipopolysaccharide export system ATP-binding protein LptB [Ferrovum sp. JA12]